MRAAGLIKALLVFPLAGGVCAAAESDVLEPSPALSPATVVRIQLQALARNDEPHRDAGIELSFRFTAPASRSINGPLARFVALVHGPVYRAILNHREARYGPLIVEENSAQQPVLLVTETGEQVGFLFTLSRELTGRFAHCWMTESIVRFEASDEEGRAWLMM